MPVSCSDCDPITGRSHYQDGIVEIVPRDVDDPESEFFPTCPADDSLLTNEAAGPDSPCRGTDPISPNDAANPGFPGDGAADPLSQGDAADPIFPGDSALDLVSAELEEVSDLQVPHVPLPMIISPNNAASPAFPGDDSTDALSPGDAADTTFSGDSALDLVSAELEDVSDLQVPHVPLPMTCVHPPVKIRPYSCHICQRSFSKPSRLRVHVTVHGSDDAFTCKICKKPFLRGSQLRRHMEVHSTDRCFECAVGVLGFLVG